MRHYLQRNCLHCTEPLSGRSDKKFCNSSCKAQYHRASSLAGTTVVLPPLSSPVPVLAEALLACSPWQVLNDHYQEEGCSHYAERYELVRNYQEQQGPFHGEYADQMETFLSCIYDQLRYPDFNKCLAEVGGVIQKYLYHPGLGILGHIAHHRLADLHLLYFYLQALGKAPVSASREEQVSGKWPETLCSYDYLTERQLKQLWANLLGVS